MVIDDEVIAAINDCETKMNSCAQLIRETLADEKMLVHEKQSIIARLDKQYETLRLQLERTFYEIGRLIVAAQKGELPPAEDYRIHNIKG